MHSHFGMGAPAVATAFSSRRSDLTRYFLTRPVFRLRSGLTVLAVACLGLTATQCNYAHLDCRAEDPGCSNGALLTLLHFALPVPVVYWGDTSNNTLYRLEDGSSNPAILWDLGTPPRRFGFEENGNTLYFAGSFGNEVYDLNLSTGTTNLLTGTPSDIKSVVVVENEGKIYLSDNGSGQVDSVDLDGNNYSLIYNPGSNRGMDIDEENDFHYVAESSQILRFNSDGTGSVIVVGATGAVNDLELDSAEGKLYWVDRSSNEVRSANIDGSNEQLIYSGLNTPEGIAFHPASPHLYICNGGDSEVIRIGKDGSEPLVIASAMNCEDIDFAPVLE